MNWIEEAYKLAAKSTCKRHGCGAIIVGQFDKVLEHTIHGWNTTIQGVECTGEHGNCRCLHAEELCIMARNIQSNSKMYLTMSPCWRCAQYIRMAGKIIEVLYAEVSRHGEGPMDFLRQWRIPCSQLSRDYC